MKRIIYSQPDGTVAVVVPSPQFIQELLEFGNTNITTYEQAVEFIAKKDAPIGYVIVDTSDIPSDRTFRNAWVKDNASIKTDIPKAKLIVHDKRRAKRAEEFAPLDIEATIPSKSQQAEAKRQRIRDKYDAMQANIDSATTEAELKQILSDGGVL